MAQTSMEACLQCMSHCLLKWVLHRHCLLPKCSPTGAPFLVPLPLRCKNEQRPKRFMSSASSAHKEKASTACLSHPRHHQREWRNPTAATEEPPHSHTSTPSPSSPSRWCIGARDGAAGDSKGRRRKQSDRGHPGSEAEQPRVEQPVHFLRQRLWVRHDDLNYWPKPISNAPLEIGDFRFCRWQAPLLHMIK
jgi:hypothetical protein